MNTDMTQQIVSTSSSATEQLAEKLGRALRGSEVIELVSDLGGGKTTFTRGLVRGAGSQDTVASPTFTISKVYQADKFAIHHFDFYRLTDAGLMEHELYDLIGDPRIVIVIEWGDIVQHILPSKRLSIRFSRTSDDTRQLDLTYPESLQYLVGAL